MATIRANSMGYAVGKAGNDTLIGNSRGNIMGGGNGNDLIQAKGGNDILAGGRGSDSLFGGAGTDLLSGGLGSDILTGGAGKDFFSFDEKLSVSNVDFITDFSVRDDTIFLSHSIFAKAGKLNHNLPVTPLKSAAFWTGEAAHDPSDRIIYNKTTGEVFYDADGTGAKAAVKFATMNAGLALTYKDFFLV